MLKETVLVTWSTNWSDEMDISGFVIMEVKKWDNFKEKLRGIKDYFSIEIGAESEIDYNCGEELLLELVAKRIDPVEVKTIKKFLGKSGGFTNFLAAGNEI
jgi:hypothetical protein